MSRKCLIKNDKTCVEKAFRFPMLQEYFSRVINEISVNRITAGVHGKNLNKMNWEKRDEKTVSRTLLFHEYFDILNKKYFSDIFESQINFHRNCFAPYEVQSASCFVLSGKL